MIKCPSCGAGLRFDVASQKAVCDYCRSSFEPASLNDNTNEDAKTERMYDSFVYICPSCGAELSTTDKNDAVGFCPYCGGSSMIFDKIRREWKPDYVIPFKITKEDCKKAYVKEVKRHPFVSKKYRDPQLIESFRGIYMPYWDYHASVKGSFKLEGRTAERAIGGNYYAYDTYDVLGEMNSELSGYSHDASVAFDDYLSEKLAPFNSEQHTAFSPAYMGGFYAESGDAEELDYVQIADDEMRAYTAEKLNKNSSISGAVSKLKIHLDKSRTKVPLRVTHSQRTLYPVWFMSYRLGDKITYAAVNGQTGKVCADLPLSPLKILLAALGIAGALFAVFALLGFGGLMPSIKANTTLGACILLLLAGFMIMQNAFINTVLRSTNISELVTTRVAANGKPLPSKTLDVSSRGKSFAFGIIASIVAAFAVIGYFSDGSYDGGVRLICSGLLMACAFVLIAVHISQSKIMKAIGSADYSSESNLRSGIMTEAKEFVKTNRYIRLGVFLAAALGVFIIYLSVPVNAVIYAYCVLLMAGLFAAALLHIKFQSKIAMRCLPQFNKKGAAYDEK